MSDHPEYSVVIPVFNTEKSLVELAQRIDVVFTTQVKSAYEIIFVDDGSANPNTWKTLSMLSAQSSLIHAIRLTRNFGQHAATLCGLRISRGNYVITLDDDLQILPEDIPAMVEMRHHDIVVGQFLHKSHSFSKRLFSRIKGYFDRIILGKPKHIQLSPLKLMNRITVDGMIQLSNTPYPFLAAMMFYITRDVVGVEAHHAKRMEGKTGYGFFKMFRMFTNLLINNSSLLLKVIGNAGLLISFLSFALALYFSYRKLFLSINVVGWTSVIVTVLFIGGLLLFSIGIIGEYLIRIIQGVDRKPTYIIREHLHAQHSGHQQQP